MESPEPQGPLLCERVGEPMPDIAGIGVSARDGETNYLYHTAHNSGRFS